MSNLHAIGDDVLFYHGVDQREIHGVVAAYHDPEHVVVNVKDEDGEDDLFILHEAEVRPGNDPDQPEFIEGTWR